MKKRTATGTKTKKKQCSLPCDRISEVPSNISQIILMFLPLRDMARTSILSKSWRHQWVKVPQLEFKDDLMYLVSQEERYRYNAKKVFEILLLHHGPILKFTLDMTSWQNCTEIDSIIPFLSRSGIKELTLLMPYNDQRYKVSSSILSCLELRHLCLSSCVLQPSTFVAFHNLVSLELSNVRLDSDVSISSCPFLESLVLRIITTVNLFSVYGPKLKQLHFEGKMTRIGVMNTPLLKVLVLWLEGELEECYTANSSSDFISLLHSLPLLEDLSLCYRFLQVLAVGDSSHLLPKVLNNLGTLHLSTVDLCHMDELTSTLWFIRSSPNLHTLELCLCGPDASIVEAERYLKAIDHSHYSLLKLQKAEIDLPISGDLRFAIEFSKFLLDVSPVLGTLYIETDVQDIDVDGYKSLVELACYPRASPKARIVYVGLESLNITIA